MAQQYESRLDFIETRVNSIITQASLSTSNTQEALERIPRTQKLTLPIKPELLNPLSVLQSLFITKLDEDSIETLKGVIKSYSNDEMGSLSNPVMDRINLTNVDLSGIDLPDSSFNNADFSLANLESTNFTRSNLESSDFQLSNLTNSILDEANIEGANFRMAEGIPGWVVKGLNNSNEFSKERLVNSIRKGFKNIENANLSSANMNGIELENAEFQNAYLARANFNQAKLAGAKFAITIETGGGTSEHISTNLHYASFKEANLESADLHAVSAKRTDFSLAVLNNIQASDVNFRFSSFIKTQLRDADLTRARFECTDLTDANLDFSDIRGAIFSEATLEGASFTNATYSDSTVFPDNFPKEMHKMIKLKDSWSVLDGFDWGKRSNPHVKCSLLIRPQ